MMSSHVLKSCQSHQLNQIATVFGQLADGLLNLSPVQQESAADKRLRKILEGTSKQILTLAQNNAIAADKKQDLRNFQSGTETLREYFYANYVTDKRTAVEKWNINEERIGDGLKTLYTSLEDNTKTYRSKLNTAFKDTNLADYSFLYQSFDIMTFSQLELLTMYQETIALKGLVNTGLNCSKIYNDTLSPKDVNYPNQIRAQLEKARAGLHESANGPTAIWNSVNPGGFHAGAKHIEQYLKARFLEEVLRDSQEISYSFKQMEGALDGYATRTIDLCNQVRNSKAVRGRFLSGLPTGGAVNQGPGLRCFDTIDCADSGYTCAKWDGSRSTCDIASVSPSSSPTIAPTAYPTTLKPTPSPTPMPTVSVSNLGRRVNTSDTILV